MTPKERLLTCRARNDAAGLEMLELQGIFDALEHSKPKAITAFNLFQTPEHIAEKMVSMLGSSLAGKRVLEPSAGLGRIVRPLLSRGAHVTAVESSAECCGYLYANFPRAVLVQKDFMLIDKLPQDFDFVCMNPPFKMGTDIKHIKHALEMLKTGGMLVSLCYDGVKQNKNLRPICDTWEVLPHGSFKESGTSASVALLTIAKR